MLNFIIKFYNGPCNYQTKGLITKKQHHRLAELGGTVAVLAMKQRCRVVVHCGRTKGSY